MVELKENAASFRTYLLPVPLFELHTHFLLRLQGGTDKLTS